MPVDLGAVLGLQPPASILGPTLASVRVTPIVAAPLAGDYDQWVAGACLASLAYFVQRAWLVLHPGEPLEWSHHHDALCDHVQWLLEGWMRAKSDPEYKQSCRHAVISLPPVCLKTEVFMIFAPAWMWLRWPSWRVLCLSCNPRVALESASQSRRVIESAWYRQTFRPEWQLLDDQNAKSKFGTTLGGSRESHGMSATTVGEHADAIFVDDPTDPKQVTRAALDEANRDWPSLRNRVTDERTALRVILQQRLDVDDLTGFVTRGKKGRDWISVVLPLEFVAARCCATPMPVDEYNRLCLDPEKVRGTWRDWRETDGELLQPSRFPDDIVEELRENAGPYGWSSQYQQDPTPREGGRVKRAWLNFCRLADHHAGDRRRPEGCPTVEEAPALAIPRSGRGWNVDFLWLSLDPASKKTERGSLWGLLACAGVGARRLVLDDRSDRGEWDQVLERAKDMVRMWRPSEILIEDTAAGPTLIKALREELASGKLCDENGRAIICRVRALTPAEVGGDKEARLDGVINQIAAGLLYLLEGGSWVEEFVNELTMFPNYPTKDRVDALTAFLAIATDPDTMWPEARAARARAEAAQRGEPTPEQPSMRARMSRFLSGAPIPGKPRDALTGAPVTECQHQWCEGRCLRCGLPV